MKKLTFKFTRPVSEEIVEALNYALNLFGNEAIESPTKDDEQNFTRNVHFEALKELRNSVKQHLDEDAQKDLQKKRVEHQ